MRLAFYTVDSSYMEYLRRVEPRLYWVDGDKGSRPFIGTVIKQGDVHFYAPLTSPKPKHQNMPNTVDFFKINQGVWGAINFNVMVPIPLECLHRINLQPKPNSSASEKQYIKLIKKQVSWCNANYKQIYSRANQLFQIFSKNYGNSKLKKRCIDFELLTYHCYLYSAEHNYGLAQKLESRYRKSSLKDQITSAKKVKEPVLVSDLHKKQSYER